MQFELLAHVCARKIRLNKTIKIMYYHVRLDYYDRMLKGNQTKYAFDFVTEQEVLEDVIAPFINKQNFVFQGCAILAEELRQVRVFQSEMPIDELVAYANECEPNAFFSYEDSSILEESQYCKEISRKIFKKFSNSNVRTEVKAISKPKKIFISHSKNDEKFVTELIRLLRLMGFERDEIFCSSVPGYWIGDGKKFLEEIKTHFMDYDLFVIFVHSPRFYDSHIALNEMGAAWVLQSDHSSFLTSDMEFDKMDAVVDNAEISVKINADDAKPRMTSWMERILKWFNKPMVDISLWENERDDFLRKVNAINYTSLKEEPKSQSYMINTALSEEEEGRLKKWVDSGDNTMFQAWYVGGSATFGLGAMNQYVVEAGREMAKWQGFFKRLLAMGLVEEAGDYHGHPKYRLTESAYTYFENKQS